jgi:hypothetical protein
MSLFRHITLTMVIAKMICSSEDGCSTYSEKCTNLPEYTASYSAVKIESAPGTVAKQLPAGTLL